jgi:uncharacterized Zn finger protein
MPMVSAPVGTSALGLLLTERALRLMAGAASFERGERYASTGRVKKLKASPSEISAVVAGTSHYQVRIWADEGSLDYSCICPMGADDVFCKHCVATGLVWLGRAAAETGDAALAVTPAEPAVDLRSFLVTCDKETLVDLLVERAAADELFDGKLGLLAARATAGPADFEPYRQAIEAAIVVDDFVDYRSMYDYSCNVQGVIGAVEGLLDDGEDIGVIELCEYALECVEDATGRVDDSDGGMGDIREQLVDLHHRACCSARPDPEQLAERLFEWAMHSEWETFLDGASQYADVLGETGLGRYRCLAAAVWEHVPAVDASDQDDRTGSRFRVTYVMEELAKLSGSVDEQVAIKARDLGYAYHYVQIVELLADAGRFDEALDWAERGLAAFPERTDVRLRGVAARELHRAGRDDEAMAVVWTELEERPNVASYELLHRHATAAGVWSEWRDRALGLLHQREARAQRGGTSADGAAASAGLWRVARGYDEHPESSELVKVRLWENDPEAAWAQAVDGGCSPALWMQLAALREREHPADAIPIYREAVEREIAAKNNRAYAEAVARMRKIRVLMDESGSGEEFAGYAAQVRAAHKPKRNLMKLFDEQGW